MDCQIEFIALCYVTISLLILVACICFYGWYLLIRKSLRLRDRYNLRESAIYRDDL